MLERRSLSRTLILSFSRMCLVWGGFDSTTRSDRDRHTDPFVLDLDISPP